MRSVIAVLLLFVAGAVGAQTKVVCADGLFPALYDNDTAFTCNANDNDATGASRTALTIEADTPDSGTDPSSGGFTLGLSESEVAQLSGATLLLFATAFGFRVVRKQFWR